jgi:hypothetical protein
VIPSGSGFINACSVPVHFKQLGPVFVPNSRQAIEINALAVGRPRLQTIPFAQMLGISNKR